MDKVYELVKYYIMDIPKFLVKVTGVILGIYFVFFGMGIMTIGINRPLDQFSLGIDLIGSAIMVFSVYTTYYLVRSFISPLHNR